MLYLVVLLAAAWPLGIFMARVYEGEAALPRRGSAGLERGLYRLAGVDPAGEMTWRQYAIAMLAFNLLGLLFRVWPAARRSTCCRSIRPACRR